MTEYADDSLEEISSDFIVRTCQLLPELHGAVSDRIRTPAQTLWREPIKHSIECGSMQEFYIRPLNPCIDDIDILYYFVDKLAFVDDCPVLPEDASGLAETITCFKIEQYSGYPGFVRLRYVGRLNYNWKYKKYDFCHTIVPNRCLYWDMNDHAAGLMSSTELHRGPTNIVRGPAITFPMKDCTVQDTVHSIWCPQWPKEVQSWPKRHRDYGWPAIDTIAEVVRNGCHAVCVQHRACRNDKMQWRLSFSVAEVILLQSWTKIQQIVYHLLRFFAKRELIRKDCPKEDEVLCTYHLKTLMLWTCEEMPQEWWNSYSVIVICCKLLQKLMEWLKRGYCPNYFIPETNLFHRPSNCAILDNAERQLKVFRKSGILCRWFVENYILLHVRIHFKDGVIRKANLNFMDYLRSLYKYRKASQLTSFDFLFSLGFSYCIYYDRHIFRSETTCSAEPRSCLRLSFLTSKSRMLRPTRPEMSVLPIPVNVWCLMRFDRIWYSLYAACNLKCGQIAWDNELFAEYVKGIFFVSLPKIVRCKYHMFPKPVADQSRFHFLRAQEFMENLTGVNSSSEFTIMSLMSNEYLKKALACDDSRSRIITPAALVYLAALNFVTSGKQSTMMDLCSAVLLNEANNLEIETLNASCLFFIDDVVRIIAFCLLCKKIQDGNIRYDKRQIYLDLRMTPKVFAHYLTVKFTEGVYNHLEVSSRFPLDQLLLSVLAKQESRISTKSGICLKVVRQHVYRRADSLTTKYLISTVDPLNLKRKLVDALTESALEKLTSFYCTIGKHFDIQFNTADCYHALYLYTCGRYDEVLHLCERILQEPDLQSDLKAFAFANVLVIPPLNSFFDKDLQSLFGFHVIFHHLSPPKDDLENFHLTNESTLAQFMDGFVQSSEEQLSDFLKRPFHIPCRYFLGRHFLARYLKLRCFIDCQHPCADILTVFLAMKSSLPFEHMIHRFLLRKLRKICNNLRVSSHQNPEADLH